MVWPSCGSPFEAHPNHLAGLRVQRVDVRVQRGHQDFPVGVGDALVHQIAAGHRRRKLVLFRSEFPDDLSHVVEVDRVDKVRIGAFEIHHVADHQRLPFLPPERAGRHGPGDMQLLGVLGVDLGQRAVADPAVASQWQNPLIRILGIFLQGFIGARDSYDCAADYDSGDHPFHAVLLYPILCLSLVQTRACPKAPDRGFVPLRTCKHRLHLFH